MNPLKPDNIEHVSQICDKSCVAACLAMVTRTNINYVINWIDKNLNEQVPYNSEATIPYLVNHGIYPQFEGNSHWIPFYKDSTYLISAPSLNIQGKIHCLVMLIGESPEKEVTILDPQFGRKEKFYYDYDSWITKELQWHSPILLFDARI